MTQISLMKKLYLSSAVFMLATSPVAFSSSQGLNEEVPASRPSSPVLGIDDQSMKTRPVVSSASKIDNTPTSESFLQTEEKPTLSTTQKPGWWYWLTGNDPQTSDSGKSADSTSANVASARNTQKVKEENALVTSTTVSIIKEGPAETPASTSDGSWFSWWSSVTPATPPSADQPPAQTPTGVNPSLESDVVTLETVATDPPSDITNSTPVPLKIRQAETLFGVSISDPNKSQALTHEALKEIADKIKTQITSESVKSVNSEKEIKHPLFTITDPKDIEARIVTKLDSNNGNFQYFMPKQGQQYRVIMWSYEENCYMQTEMTTEQLIQYKEYLANEQTAQFDYNCRHVIKIN